jgi:hypothetical protein
MAKQQHQANGTGGFLEKVLFTLGRRNGSDEAQQPISPLEAINNLAAAIQELNAERASANEALTTAADEREKLLLQPGADARLDELDAEISRQQRRLERCDKLEPLLLAQLRDQRDASRQSLFRAFTDSCQSLVAEFCESLRDCLRLKQEIAALRDRAQASGFNEAGFLFELPHLQACEPNVFEYTTQASLRSFRPTAPGREQVRLRFTRQCGIYRQNDIAGFSPEDADAYIRAAVAETVR